MNRKFVLLDSLGVSRTHSEHCFDQNPLLVLFYHKRGPVFFVCGSYLMGPKSQGHHLMTYYLSSRTCRFAGMNEAFVVGLTGVINYPN